MLDGFLMIFVHFSLGEQEYVSVVVFPFNVNNDVEKIVTLVLRKIEYGIIGLIC